MNVNTSFYPINIFHKISHTKISFSYHQIHNTKIPLNKTNLSFYAQKFQSFSVYVDSNNCYNSKQSSFSKLCSVRVDLSYFD